MLIKELKVMYSEMDLPRTVQLGTNFGPYSQENEICF